MTDLNGEMVTRRIEDIRAWRDSTEGLYGLPHHPSDPPMTCNNKGWWQDVDALLREVDRLREGLFLLHQWDMLTLDAEGHGIVTADAPWARSVISAALGSTPPSGS